jgi:hypothetical protein
MPRDLNTDENRRLRLLLAGEVLQHPQLPRLLALLSSGGRQYAKLPSVMCEAVARAVLEGSPGFAGCAGARAGMLAGDIYVSARCMLEKEANRALAALPLCDLDRDRRLSGPVGGSVTKVSPAAGGGPPARVSCPAAPGAHRPRRPCRAQVLRVNACGSRVVTCKGDMDMPHLCGHLSRHLSALATADPNDEAPPAAADPESLEAAMAAAAQELLGAAADADRLRSGGWRAPARLEQAAAAPQPCGGALQWRAAALWCAALIAPCAVPPR